MHCNDDDEKACEQDYKYLINYSDNPDDFENVYFADYIVKLCSNYNDLKGFLKWYTNEINQCVVNESKLKWSMAAKQSF